MNFFKSIISDDDDLPGSEIRRESEPHAPLNPPHDENNPNGVADGWSFGGLIKTFAVQSESVIEIYRRDLQEFGVGLRKETEVLRETASRAVKDLPASIEAAHGVLKSTASIISKESLGLLSDGDPETPGTNRSLNSGRYSRFEAQLSAIQNDLNTFCEEPEDVDDYRRWKSGFELENYKEEIEGLIEENGVMEGAYRRVVPSAVDHETFWCRYLYRVDKLKQQESLRANLVKRAILVNDDEEELSWDFDDDDNEDNDQNAKGADQKGDNASSNEKSNNPSLDQNVEGADQKGDNAASDEKSNNPSLDKPEEGNANVNVSETMEKEEEPETVGGVKSEEESVKDKDDEKVNVEEKGESGKKGDASVVEDVEWDEIEDTGSGDEKGNSTVDHRGSPNKDDIRKRLSSAKDDDDEDLSWDIEDDDEPVKV